MAYRNRFRRAVGPEVVTCKWVEVGRPGSGEVRIRHHASGLNYADIHLRSGK